MKNLVILTKHPIFSMGNNEGSKDPILLTVNNEGSCPVQLMKDPAYLMVNNEGSHPINKGSHNSDGK